MIVFILKWALRNCIPLAVGASLVALPVIGWHKVAVASLNASHASEIVKLNDSHKAMEKAQADKCEADKKITEEVSGEYQEKLAALNNSLADARRLLDRRCPVPVSLPAKPSAGRDGSSCEIKPSGQDDRPAGVDANALLDIAAEGEKYRIQLIGCQEFVRKLK